MEVVSQLSNQGQPGQGDYIPGILAVSDKKEFGDVSKAQMLEKQMTHKRSVAINVVVKSTRVAVQQSKKKKPSKIRT
jgi:hypothetical protein